LELVRSGEVLGLRVFGALNVLRAASGDPAVRFESGRGRLSDEYSDRKLEIATVFAVRSSLACCWTCGEVLVSCVSD
jgi:hypothetical protein